MPTPSPNLDDRRFDDLVEEMLARIPAHTPEWTHPRPGDPGRTLVELFAWLGDTLLYRANLVPERQRLVFLRLLGQRLRPALPARTVVSLSHAQPLPPRLSVLRPGARIDGPLPFETAVETGVLPLEAEAWIKRPLDEAEQARMGELIEGLGRIHRIRGPVSGYQARALFDAGRAEPAGVDVFGDSLDHALWLALLAPEAASPEEQADLNRSVRDLVGGEGGQGPALLSVGVVPAIARAEPFEDIGPRARIPVQWELTAPGDLQRVVDYQALSVVPGSDTTAGLTRPGTLRLALPRAALIQAPSNDVGENPMAGVGDAPPRLDDEDKAARLVAWLRLRPAPGQPDLRLRLSWIGINAVEVEQRQTLAGQVLGQSSGAADQVFRLPMAQVEPGSLQVQVEDPGGRGYLPWHRVDDLAAISDDPTVARDANAFELDAAEGTIRFGDGVRGRVPEGQMRVRLALGRFGGGRAGNLPPGSLSELVGRLVDGRPAPAIKAQQPLACEGGVDAETLDEAERRIPAWLNHRDRAVTAADYRRLALDTPGLEVGRVEVLPRFTPRDRRFGKAGAVSVMALPLLPLPGPPCPRPDRPFLETLHAHLSARVPLTTELYVIGCEYVALGVSVAVRIRDGHGREQVLQDVRDALRRLLWPLSPGGGDGDGWPLGRNVRDRELEVAVSRVAGVREIAGRMRMFARASLTGGDDWRELPRAAADGSQELELAEWQLPELLAVVAVDAADDDVDVPPSSLRALPNPFASDLAVAVPVVPEVC